MYKLCALTGLLLVYTAAAYAQYSCKTMTKGDTIYQRCYYTTGQLSTEICYLHTNERWKHLKVYTKTHELSYENSYGQRYGSSHVDLRYQADGGVASAHYTMQPDGGIQYTDVTTYFKADGTQDHVEDNSRGNDGEPHLRLLRPQEPKPIAPTPQTSPQPSKPNECAPVPGQKKLYLINYTSETLQLIYQYKDGRSSAVRAAVEPSDTTVVGVYSSYRSSSDPLQHYGIQVASRPKTGYQYQVKPINSGDTADQYVIVVCRKVKTKR